MRTSARFTGPLLLLVCLAFASPTPALGQATVVDSAAVVAAEDWLAWLAAEEYQTSWEEAGEMFRAETTAEAWAEQAAAGHRAIGDMVAREVAELLAVTNPHGAPPGDYVYIRYLSEFDVAGPAMETMVLIREAERGWRVIGYFVQPAPEE